VCKKLDAVLLLSSSISGNAETSLVAHAHFVGIAIVCCVQANFTQAFDALVLRLIAFHFHHYAHSAYKQQHTQPVATGPPWPASTVNLLPLHHHATNTTTTQPLSCAAPPFPAAAVPRCLARAIKAKLRPKYHRLSPARGLGFLLLLLVGSLLKQQQQQQQQYHGIFLPRREHGKAL